MQHRLRIGARTLAASRRARAFVTFTRGTVHEDHWEGAGHGRGLAVFDRLSGPKTRVAATKAINDGAFHYRRCMRQHMHDVFD